jgi:phosphoglycolate phosphatase-like HAD superfamily hydrolase
MSNIEADYQETVSTGASGRFLPGTKIEVMQELSGGSSPEHVLFDFDGTLSLVREGWPEVMIPMMVKILLETGTDESAEELGVLVEKFVMELNGKQTIYQMIRLAEEITRRGGSPKEPLAYKHLYHELLMKRIRNRREDLRTGKTAPEEMLVPHSFDILGNLRDRGVQMYIASGTDEPYVKEEAELLGLTEYFGDQIYGAVDDYKTFSKAQVIERILETNKVDGHKLLGFGDGYVEIQNIKEHSGIAVAVASDESGRSGEPDQWKRKRLIGVGADVVIPDYREHAALLELIWNGS